MHVVLLLVLLVAACKRPEPAPNVAAPDGVAGPCRSLLFEGDRFTVCRDPGATIELHVAGRDGRAFRSFAALEHVLGKRAADVRFAVNAGMFDEEGLPIGLAVADGQTIKPLNRRVTGGGNFHMQPNGVFLVRKDGSASVLPTSAFERSEDIVAATQSGPMLVIDGQVNSRFDFDGQSRYVRNGVGVDAAGVPIFAISEAPVSFGKFARLFKDALGAPNALYLDGSVSSLWDPVNGRMDSFTAIGPMLVAFAKEPG